MRRILRKIAASQYDELGDVSTLANPSIVEDIKAKHMQMNKEQWNRIPFIMYIKFYNI